LSKYDDAKNNTTKIFDYALKKYKTQVSKVIFIDDTEHNCEVARKMGIKTILAKNARQIIKDAKKMLRIK
jgi:FMN phosphatase YigB (HAD superfamily)